ncbi:ImuA family protein [Pacificimonas flava]|nr:protein ImuA [Pacificimonas flava]MBB5281667.1 protein ImuA [Pacificimonas flava]
MNLAQLREAIDMGAPGARDTLPFGCAPVDRRISGGGLAMNAVHEVVAASTSLSDDAAATLFLAGIGARFAEHFNAPILWAASRFDLYAPGLEQAGLLPASVIYAEASDDKSVLAIVEDALRDGTPAAVIGEVRSASLVATRRLQLAAGKAGQPVLLLRRWRKAEVDPLSAPSAAVTRWRIASASASPLPVAGVGRPRWRVELARQRGGEPHIWELEGCDARGRLAVPAPSRGRAGSAAGTAYRQVA